MSTTMPRRGSGHGDGSRSRRQVQNDNSDGQRRNKRGQPQRDPRQGRHQEPPKADPELLANLAAAGLIDANSDGSFDLTAIDTYDRRSVRSLNHLLNFSFPERERPSASSRTRNSSRHMAHRSLPHNKERYVHANFRFLVNLTGSYEVNLYDPDTPVSWDAIEQVIATTHEEPCCPICLSKPQAAQITKCGHVYCWVCVLHYLALGEKKWRRCPVCFESVYADDLRPVSVQPTTFFQEGSTIRMNLIKRAKTAYVASPVSQWHNGLHEIVPMMTTQGGSDVYAKLQLASKEVLQQLVTQEAYDLMLQYVDAVTDGNTDTLQFITDAMHRLSHRAHSLDCVDVLQRFVPYLDGTLKSPTQARAAHDALVASRPPSSPALVPFDPMKVYQTQVPLASFRSGKISCANNSNSNQTAAHPMEPTSPLTTSFSDVQTHKQVDLHEHVPSASSHAVPTAPVAVPTKSVVPAELSPEQAFSYDAAFSSASDTDEDATTNTCGRDSYSDTNSNDGDEINIVAVANSPRKNVSRASSTGSEDAFYFYQANDGQHLYLHPLNIRMLREEYGLYNNFPPVLEAKIIDIEEAIQTDEARRRYRPLEHLPLSCEFSLLELDLGSTNLVGRRTLSIFRNELRERDRRRRNKQRKEITSGQRAEIQAAKEMASLASDFPSLSMSERNPAVLPVGEEWGPLPSGTIVPPSSQSPLAHSSSSYARVATAIMSDMVANPPLPKAGSNSANPAPTKTAVPMWSSIARQASISPSPAIIGVDAQAPKANGGSHEPVPALDLEVADTIVPDTAGPNKKKKRQQVLLTTTSLRRY